MFKRDYRGIYHNIAGRRLHRLADNSLGAKNL